MRLHMLLPLCMFKRETGLATGKWLAQLLGETVRPWPCIFALIHYSLNQSLMQVSERQMHCRRGHTSGPRRRWWLQPTQSLQGQAPVPTSSSNKHPLYLAAPTCIQTQASPACHTSFLPASVHTGLQNPVSVVSSSHIVSTRHAVLCHVGAGGRSTPLPDEPVLGSNPRLGGNPYWWEDLEDYQEDEEDYTRLTPDEVADRVDEAASFISVLEDLQPMPQQGHNAFAEVWTRLRRVPPSARARVLNEIEPGALKGLWKASMSRYILPDSLALHLLAGFSVLEDFPAMPGQVAEYQGCAEQWQYVAPDTKFAQDRQMQSRYPRSAPWLRPNQGRYLASRKHFTQQFFLHPRSGALHSRLIPPLVGPFSNLFVPLYCRVRPGLVLTPLEADAGADMTFEYGPTQMRDTDGQDGPPPATAQSFKQDVLLAEDAGEGQQFPGEGAPGGEELLAEDLPVGGWPKPPADEMRLMSPFSGTRKDYVRVVGPGMYVGCAYPTDAYGTPDKDSCVYFLLARKR